MELKVEIVNRFDEVRADHVGSIVIPIPLAILTWIDVLLLVGYLARLNQLTVLNVTTVFFAGLLFWPVYRAAPWRTGLTERVRRWVHGRTSVFDAVIGLWLLPLLPNVPELLISLVQLPYRGSGIFFGTTLFYREHLGTLAAQRIFQLVWLYLLATGLVGLIPRVR